MSTVSINCPHCQSTAIRRKGMTSSGNQRYLCKACHKSFTLTPVGRPCIGDRPLTNYEKLKRYRQAKKLKLMSDWATRRSEAWSPATLGIPHQTIE